jgi:hypothetical protein
VSVSRFAIRKLGLALPLLFAANVAAAQSQVDPAVLSALKQRQSTMDPALAALAKAPEAQRRAMSRLLGPAATDTRMITLDMAGQDVSAMSGRMTAMGAEKVAVYGNTMSARVPIANLGQLLSAPGMRVARPAMATRNAGVVTSQGDPALRSNVARQRVATLAGGRGVRVGVLSDSFNCNPAAAVPGTPSTTAEQDFANGDLPADYIVLDPGTCPGGTDEGRGMAQLIYDVAPQSTGAFHTAFGGIAGFATGILELANDAGSDVIVDDVIFFAEPMFQDGPIAQAATAVTQQGVPYFSSAGNNGRGSYEDDFRPVTFGPNFVAHDFDPGPGVDIFQTFLVAGDATGFAQVTPSFQWDEPFFSVSGGAGSASDLDMVYFGMDGNPLLDCFLDMDPVRFPDTMGFPPVCQFGQTINTGGDAVELTSVVSFVGDQTVQVLLVKSAGPNPTRVKYVPFVQGGNGFAIAEFDTQSGTSYGHANAPGVMGIGAAPFSTTAAFNDQDFGGNCLPACAEPFTSAGGLEIRFDNAGNRLATPSNRMKPDVTGPDGSNTSFFIADSSIDDDDGDGLRSPGLDGENPAEEFPNFFGTSAAAPHVAAVAALMLDASEILPIASNNGTQQRVCIANRLTVLVAEAQAATLLAAGPQVARAGFCLTPAAIERALESTALDMTRVALDRLNGVFADLPNSTGFDFDTGAGFVNAEGAIRAVAPRRR